MYKLMMEITLGFALLQAGQTGNDPEKQLQAAINKEVVEGDLKSAIELYKMIVDDSGDNHAVAAQSLLRLGGCYEKLGTEEARNAYEKVIKNYPSEVEVVNLAKERLSALQEGSKIQVAKEDELQLQQIWARPHDSSGTPSPDGRYVSFVNWDVPCLALYHIETGERMNIPSTTGEWGEVSIWPENSIWSPDGKKLAFVWYGEEHTSIRIVGIDSSEPEEIFSGENAQYCHPYTWSSDGKYVLVVLCMGKEGHEIGLVSVEEHTYKMLKKLEGGSHPWCSLSPDDKTFAYSYTPDLDDPQTDIYLVDIEDGSETVVVDHPKTDYCPLWMPDGKSIVFFSDRTGMVSVWSQKISDGKADGEEKLIKNLNRLDPMGIDKEGNLYLTFREGLYDVYNAVINPATGKLVSPPERVVESNIGWNGGSCFSPDGKSMAYVSQRGVLDPQVSWGQQILIIRDLETGEERELIPKLKMMLSGPISPPQWSPDGDEIVVTGRDEVGHNGAFIIDLNDASYFSLLGDEQFIGRETIWSDNNSKLYYRIIGTKDSNGFYEIDRRSNTQSLVINDEAMQEMRLHPEGNLLAYTTVDGGRRIGLLDIEKKETSDLIEFEPEVGHSTVAWSPNGEWLYFMKCFGEDKPVELWRTTPDGKRTQLIGDSFPHFVFFSVHPDGRKLTFTVGKRSGDYSLWVMKNFIP